MKKYLFLLPFFLITLCSSGQVNVQAITDSITAEGKKLYQSEMASWYGTDIFMAVYKDKSRIGGYLSYMDKETARCIFFSKSESDIPVVIGSISFDETYNIATAVTNYSERPFTETEKDLYMIRKKTLDIINTHDTLFKHYPKTNYNLVPLISNGQKKVYILTGPQNNGVVIFGNDYLLAFDEQNELVTKKQLHKNIISLSYSDKMKDGEKVVAGAHTHLPETGEFMTATDICTLMLYEKFANWEQHYVVSEHYMNIWDCKENRLVAITREAMDKINKDQKKIKKDD
jgi:hypothetical protein